jgi:PAS domain S-box-containing protein
MNTMLTQQLRQALQSQSLVEVETLLDGLFQSAERPDVDEKHAQALRGLRALLGMVDESYHQFGRAQELRLRSLTDSSNELTLANTKLREEAGRQQALLDAVQTLVNRLLSASGQAPIPTGEQSIERLTQVMGNLITDSESVQTRLIESETRFRGLASLSSDWYWEEDDQGRFTLMSQGITAVTGLDPAHFLGKTRQEAFAADASKQRMEAQQRLAQLFEARQPFRDFELTYTPPGREGIHISLSGEPCTAADGRFVGYRGVGRNITVSKLAAQHLQEAMGLTETVLDVTPTPIAIKDDQLRFVRVNDAFVRLFELPREQWLGKTAREVRGGDAHRGEAEDRELLAQPRVLQYEQKRMLPSGGAVCYIVTKAPLLAADGSVSRIISTYIDITGLKETEAGRAEQLRLTTTLLDASPTPTVVKDRSLMLTRCNTAYEKLFDVRREDIINQPLSAHRSEIAEEVRRIEMQLLENPGSHRIERTIKSPAGRGIHCIIEKSTYFNLAGEVEGVITTFTDITELKRTEQHLTVAKQAAEQAMRARSQFLANMSHEIRTPMNGVLGMASVLGDTPLDAQQQEYLHAIRISGESLLKIVNDILDFSKIEAGKVEIEQSAFDLRSRVASILQLFAASARSKNITLTSACGDNVPWRIVGDAVRISQTLSNLIGNAIKFTETGGVSVKVGVQMLVEDQYLLRFDVRDTGIGISRDAIERIFDPFSQEDATTTRRFGGTGLGLTISRQLAGLMGGELFVESTQGSGSCFSFTVKVRGGLTPNDSVEPKPAVVSTAVPAAMHGLDVLLAEDNHVNQIVAGAMLKKLGCRVTVANDGQQAVDKIKERQFDLILMDCHMPNLDGYAATAAIRELEKQGHPRHTIIAQTANAMEGDRDSCIAAGMDDYISKPINAKVLAEVLQRWAPKVTSDTSASPITPE